MGERTRTDLNATVQWTVACRRLDGGNTIVFAKGENASRVCLPQPTLRTEKDIGSENPETTTVSGFFYVIFQGEIQKISFHQNDLWGGLELNLKAIPVEKFETL